MNNTIDEKTERFCTHKEEEQWKEQNSRVEDDTTAS